LPLQPDRSSEGDEEMMPNCSPDIVVVDDNPVLLSVLSEIFQECGHSVRVASDGFAGLAEIRNRVPDILLSDLFMPRMSGFELLSVVRRRFPSIRVIAMSGAYPDGVTPPGVAADAFYAKGVSSVAQLIQIVSAISRDATISSRPSAPIWISEISRDHAGAAVLFVSCPECLRPFPHCTAEYELSQREERCPHCSIQVEIALVRQSQGTDGTPIATTPAKLQFSESAMRARRSDGTPTGRMHQR
jgi:CheY-like chemotaxis protein